MITAWCLTWSLVPHLEKSDREGGKCARDHQEIGPWAHAFLLPRRIQWPSSLAEYILVLRLAYVYVTRVSRQEASPAEEAEFQFELRGLLK